MMDSTSRLNNCKVIGKEISVQIWLIVVQQVNRYMYTSDMSEMVAERDRLAI